MDEPSQPCSHTAPGAKEGQDVESGSPAEASDSLIESGESDEQVWRRGLKQPTSRIRELNTILRSWRWLLELFLTGLVVALLWDRQSQRQNGGKYESNGDITGFAPKITQQVKTFVPDLSYAPENASEFFTAAVRQKWIDLVPKGLGFINMEHPEHHSDLPTPLTGYGNRTVFTTSMTHQLHCLYVLAEYYFILAAKIGSLDKSVLRWHPSHCFEYLRQSIMCCGDTALEGDQTTFPPGVAGSDGWDAKHVCRDYEEVYAYLEENRADDRAWIG